MTSASLAAGWPVHVAVMAAHAGTAGVGDGDGDGLGDGVGVGDGEGLGDGEGELWTDVVAEPQPATIITTASASNPTRRLTGHRNEEVWREVTMRRLDTKR